MGEDHTKKSWFQQTMKEHQEALIRFTQRLTWNEEEAKEVVQESFLKLWKQTYPEVKSRIPAWLFFVCRNHAIDLARKNKKSRSWDQESDLPSNMLGPEDILLTNETLKIIRTLKSKAQEVLILKFCEGLSYQEISKITGLSPSHVGVLIHQSMKTLRTSVHKGTPS
ncbi:MAG: sigma-70 family RNA polymerase sigma factor [Bdellovibrionota bacterium]